MEGVTAIASTWSTESRTPPRDRVIANLAERQHGVVALPQLLALGLAESSVRERVRAGRLHRVHRGVYAIGHSVLSSEGRLIAAVLASGPGALLSHRSAAALHGLRPDNRPVIDVTSPRRGLHRVGPIRRHHSGTLSETDRSVVDGIPCTSVARTLLDLAEEVDRQGLRRACNQAEVLRIFDLAELEDVLSRSDGRRGAPVLREILASGRIGEAITRNDLEEAFLTLCDQAGLPVPRVNAWIPLEGGDVEADFYWPEYRLIAETDGGETHDTPHAFQADRRRDQKLMRAGYRVVRFTWWQVFREADEVTETLRALLRT
jgi:predicted transcriptional regulator of viral defense system